MSGSLGHLRLLALHNTYIHLALGRREGRHTEETFVRSDRPMKYKRRARRRTYERVGVGRET